MARFQFYVKQQTSELLVLQEPAALMAIVGLLCLIGGAGMLRGVASGTLEGVNGPVARAVAAAGGLGIVLYGVHELFSARSIRVDRGRQTVSATWRLLGLWLRRRALAFAQIKGVMIIAERSDDQYWTVALVPIQGPRWELLSSTEWRFVDQISDALQRLIGCPLLRAAP